jgi:hypothetical protein
VPEEIDGLDVDLSRLPSDLQPLAPLIRKWAVGDDEERSARLAEASDDELQELRDAPERRWDAINTYLDENMTSDEPYEAIVLDYFSQAAMEAANLLDERRSG